NDTVNSPPDDWVWNGVDWQAQATVQNSSCVTPAPQPEFVHVACEDEGGGIYRHDYKLTNYGGSVVLYNVDTDYEYRYGWIEVISPTGWQHDPVFMPGPMSRWVTTSSGCDVGSEMLGFSIRAGTPDLYWGGVYLTDVNDVVVAEGITQWPAPTGPLFIHTGTDDLGNGTYRHDYKLSNLAGDVELHDVDVDYEYRYGWIEVDSPNGTTFYHGPMSRWFTDQASWKTGTEYGGFSIYAGTPDVYYGGAYLTDLDHAVVAQCNTLWPEADPGPVLRYDGCVEESPGVWLHNYTLSNTEGAEPVYDIDCEIDYRNAWFEVGAPNGWAVQYIGVTTLLWQTDDAPCNVGAELGGFYIRAGTPELTWGGLMFTGDGHVEIAQGTTSWPRPLGDMDCDGRADVFDIGAFVLALTNAQDYPIQYPDCDINLADCNMDGAVDIFDIDAFVAVLVGD
ncbi:MAG: hypothetical protein JXO22_13560, partial [Phycisphaerae bacterium]|nr:hypothetical protein [Phycisphaerae bacterium]